MKRGILITLACTAVALVVCVLTEWCGGEPVEPNAVEFQRAVGDTEATLKVEVIGPARDAEERETLQFAEKAKLVVVEPVAKPEAGSLRTVRIRTLDSSKQPLSDIPLYCSMGNGEENKLTLKTGADGFALVELLPLLPDRRIPLTVFVRHPRYANVVVHVKKEDLEGGQTELELELEPAGRIVVQVRDSKNGAPIVGVLVTSNYLNCKDRTTRGNLPVDNVRFAMTNERGEAGFFGLAIGSWTFSANTYKRWYTEDRIDLELLTPDLLYGSISMEPMDPSTFSSGVIVVPEELRESAKWHEGLPEDSSPGLRLATGWNRNSYPIYPDGSFYVYYFYDFENKATVQKSELFIFGAKRKPLTEPIVFHLGQHGVTLYPSLVKVGDESGSSE